MLLAVSLSPLSNRCDCCFSLFPVLLIWYNTVQHHPDPVQHRTASPRIWYRIVQRQQYSSQGCTDGLYKYGPGPARAARLGRVGLPHRNCNCEENSHMAATPTHSWTPLCWHFRALAVAQNLRWSMPSRYCRSMHQVWCVNLIQILS